MSAKKSKKTRKMGRNEAHCKVYKNTNRREHNKIAKLNRHLKVFPGDSSAITAVETCKGILGIKR